MKLSLLLIVVYAGLCHGSFLLPINELIKQKCSVDNDPVLKKKYEEVIHYQRICLDNATDFSSAQEENATFPQILAIFYYTFKNIQCLDSVNKLGMECLPLEDKIFINMTMKAYNEIHEYMFQNDEQRITDFTASGVLDCLHRRAVVIKCLPTAKLDIERSESCKFYSELHSCLLREIKENCENYDPLIPHIIEILQSTACTSEKLVRVNRDIQLANMVNTDTFLSLFSWRTRVTRNVGALGHKLGHLEGIFKNLCQDKLTELETALESMKTCVRAKHMFVTRRDEFIKHIDHCSKETIKVLNECLPEKYRYFPQLLFKIVESIIRLLYDDFGEISRGLSPCLAKLKTVESKEDYLNCVARVGLEYDDKIPESKKEFCDEFIPTSECFIKQINDTCTTNDDLEKFTKDYMKAVKEPCK